MRLLWWRKRKMNEREFLRLVMRAVTYGYEIELQPPKKPHPVERMLRLVEEIKDCKVG